MFILAACIGNRTPQGGWAAPVLSDQYVYLGAKDGRITRLQLEDGSFDTGWGFPAPSENTLGPLYGTPRVTEDGRIFAASYDCRGLNCDAEVYGVSADTGAPLWAEGTFKLSTAIVGAVAVDGNTLLFGTSKVDDPTGASDAAGYLYALDASPETSQRVLWRFPTSGKVWGTPVVDNGVVYFGDMEGNFYAVSLAGEGGGSDEPARELWRFKAEGAIVAEPVVRDGKIYIGDFNNDLYALDMGTRRERRDGSVLGSGEWQFKADGWFWAGVFIDQDVVYAGTLNGNFYALDLRTGTERWANPGSVDGQIVGRPAVFEDVGGPALAVPSGSDGIAVFNARTGEELNGFATNGGVKATVVANGDFLYVHTTGDDLLKFRVSDRTQVLCIDAETGAVCA